MEYDFRKTVIRSRVKGVYSEINQILDGTAEEAIRQIDDRGYLIPYTADEREVVKVGVAFDATTRNLGEWLIEKTL